MPLSVALADRNVWKPAPHWGQALLEHRMIALDPVVQILSVDVADLTVLSQSFLHRYEAHIPVSFTLLS